MGHEQESPGLTGLREDVTLPYFGPCHLGSRPVSKAGVAASDVDDMVR